MKKLFTRLFVIVIPIAVVVIAVNYSIDPANQFRNAAYVKGIAAIMKKGHNVDNVLNYDERKLQEEVLRFTSKPPDVLVMGSSRIMEIGTGFFGDKTVRNIGVSHGNIDDQIALAGVLDSLGLLPREIYFNVDPFLVEEGGSEEWRTLYPYHRYFTTKYTCAPQSGMPFFDPVRKGLRILSPEYFKESVQFYLSGKSTDFKDAGTAVPEQFGRFADGTVSYAYNYRHPDTVRMKANAVKQAMSEKAYSRDTLKMQRFTCLLDFFQRAGIKVHFLIMPLQPDYFEASEKRHQNQFSAFETWIRSLASGRGISCYGHLNPAKLGMGNSWFYDTYHCSGEAIKKFILIQ